MKALYARSLRFRFLLLVAVVILPGVGLTLFENLEKRSDSAAEAKDRALMLARLAATNHARLVEDTRRKLESFALVSQVRGDDPEACHRFLKDALDRNDLVDVAVVTLEGQVWASEHRKESGVSFSERPFLRQVLATGDFTDGAYEVTPDDGRATLTYSAPVKDDEGRLRRVIIASLDLARFSREAMEAGLPPGGSLLIVDREGAVLYRYPGKPAAGTGRQGAKATLVAEMIDQWEGTTLRDGLDGVERLHGFCPLRSLGRASGVLAVGIPAEFAFGPANAALLRNLAVLLAAAVAVGLGIWLVGERLVLRRIDRLARAAARLSKGDLQSRAGLSGEDEIARAGRVFDEMASRLQDLVERTRGQREDLARQVRHLVLRRTREVSSLNRLVQILHACRSPDEVCRIVGEFMGEIFSGDRGAFLVMDPTRHKVRALAEFGGPEAPLDRRTWSVEDCWALRRGQIHRVEDTRKGLVCRHLGDAPFVASLCVPVIAHGEVLGVLHLENLNTVGSPGWIESRERLAATVAEQCALAIANLTLRETLREQTLRDPLTGLFNRRFLAEALAGERGQSWKQSGSVGVVMVDIDHFKKFNDLHGHDVGDAVLVAVAKRLAGSVRSDDLVCRIGGEEFVVVLPGLDVERSERRAEHLRRRVAALRVRHRGQTFGPVTVSAGVACWPLHGRLPSDLLRAADAALYQAKIAGRNRVIAAGRDRFLVSSVKAQAGD